MSEILQQAIYFGAMLTLGTYGIGVLLKKKFSFAFFNPILISMLLCILILKCLHIDYEAYDEGAKYISYLLTPATICLAVPLYEQIEALKKNALAVFLGILSGVLASLTSVLVFSLLFHLQHTAYVSLLPKSITTAMGMGVSEELGGYVSLTVIVIVLTGVLGNMFAEGFLKLIQVKEPVAKGIAIGTSSHAIGTAKAMELGEVEGAMSGLSIGVAGVLTVILATVYAQFI